jgi:3-hydroxyisobutyrate dehydrogenase-like beta-hydroxyacid dehydrogenase
MSRVTVAVLGLGEAGSILVADLLRAGATVRAYDPVVPAPPATTACTGEAMAVRGADLVLSVNSAADSVPAAAAGGPSCGPGAVWADLNTASPDRKLEAAGALPPAVRFADVALMAPVPGSGLRTPMIASGPGAPEAARLLTGLGARIAVLDSGIGEAARRKLLRSVFFKGLAAAVTESLAAARARGLEDWMRAEIAGVLRRADDETVRRLEEGSRRHAVRRVHEMDAAVEMLAGLGVPPRISTASRDWLADLADDIVDNS